MFLPGGSACLAAPDTACVSKPSVYVGDLLGAADSEPDWSSVELRLIVVDIGDGRGDRMVGGTRVRSVDDREKPGGLLRRSVVGSSILTGCA